MHDLLFILYAFLALGLLVLASPPHFRSANIGACLLVVWCFIGTLGFLVNAITWWDNVDDHAPVWCDIWVKLQLGISTGIASACLCINRRLMVISSATRSSVSARERKAAIWIDLAIGIIPAAFIMAISYTRQANRYTISEGFGCAPSIWYDVYGLLGLFVPPLLIGLVSFGYGAVAIYTFASRRVQFQTVLQKSGGGLNTSRFVRLISLSLLEMLVSVPLSAYSLGWIANKQLVPIISWTDLHVDWYRIDTFNAALLELDASTNAVTLLSRWIPVFPAFFYFMFFGMQEEALTAYTVRGTWIAQGARRVWRKTLGRNPSVPDSVPSRAHLPNLGSASAPVSPSTPYFPGRSADDLEHGGLSLKMTNDGEKDSSLGFKPSGISVRIDRTVA